VFDPSLSLQVLVRQVLTPSGRPKFEATLLPVRELIARGWGTDPTERPTFDDILTVLQQLEFKLFPEVDGRRIGEFIESVTQWEGQNPLDPL
jgi:hypothetical protein